MYTKPQPPCASVTDAGTCIQQQQLSVAHYWALLQLSSLSASHLSLGVCLCLSVSPSVYPSVCLSSLSLSVSICQSLPVSVHLSLCLSLSRPLFVSLSVDLYLCLTILVPTDPHPSLVFYSFPILSVSLCLFHRHPPLTPHPSRVFYPFLPHDTHSPETRLHSGDAGVFSLALTFPSSTLLQVLQCQAQ